MRNLNRFHMNIAEQYSQLSHAKRLKVGAVIVKDNRIISVGYNGTFPGASNVCEYKNAYGDLVTNLEVLHAEENAICFAAKAGISPEGSSLFTTHSPCFNCSKLIIQLGIKKVYYREIYDPESLAFLGNHIDVFRI